MLKTYEKNISIFREKYNDVTDFGLKWEWDVIKMEIRSFILQYSKKKARREEITKRSY